MLLIPPRNIVIDRHGNRHERAAQAAMKPLSAPSNKKLAYSTYLSQLRMVVSCVTERQHIAGDVAHL
jgi:hypothetical protein